MTPRKSKLYFAILLLSYLIICLLRSDRNVFVFQEYISHPYQNYTEQIVKGDALFQGDFSPNYLITAKIPKEKSKVL